MKQKALNKQSNDDFFSVLTHELKSPLTPIQTYLPLLESEKLGKLNLKQKEGLKIISNNIHRLNHLIIDVLTMSRLDSREIKFNFENISIKNLLSGVIKSLQWEIEQKNIKLTTHFPSLPLIEGDSERLSQVFHNLIKNAIKFTPRKGKINVSAKKKGYSFIISVKDTGIGIPARKLNNIFDKFYQVDNSLSRKYPGSGLGLTICDGIMKAHGGAIKVKSELKKGTTFEVVLPYKKLGKPTEAFGEVIRGKSAGEVKEK